MFGEAVVIKSTAIAEDFRYIIKQKGAMLAKGWLLGLQFEALLENDLYFEITAHANRMADQLRKTLRDIGYPLLVEGASNQVFPILPNKLLDKLAGEFTYSLQEVIDDDHKAVRFCTSWGTTQESMDALCRAIEEFTL
jgi:threonine aldolase